MTEATVMALAERPRPPDWLYQRCDLEYRRHSPEWVDRETGQLRPPPVYVELFVPGPHTPGQDLGPFLYVQLDGFHSALGYAKPERIARTVRWPIPRVVMSEEFYEVLARVVPLAGRVAEGLSVEIVDGRPCQRLTTDADTAQRELDERLAIELAGWPLVEGHDVDGIPRGQLEAAVDADTDDAGLAAAAEGLRAAITPVPAGQLRRA